MELKDIKISWVRNLLSRARMYGISEIDDITMQPQTPEEGRAMRPEAQVVIENSDNMIIVILLAKHTNGLIYSSYEKYTQTGSQGCWPAPKWGPGQKTIRESLRVRLEELRNHHDYYSSFPDEKVCRTAEKALHELNRGSLYQMSIFDML